MDKIRAQQVADERWPQWKQPLKTVHEAMAVHGWPQTDKPDCCGEPIYIESFIGVPYLGGCKKCGKFVVSVDAPEWGNSWVAPIDPEKVDLDTDKLWIAATRITQ